ncbi:unnamed protein product [Durusdinium trenchii]|uniref:Uncharacterized protein n=1 Tax=Durusdinium trenchii TaxID=1381693 RepID=A0ABP0L6B2_9DINO
MISFASNLARRLKEREAARKVGRRKEREERGKKPPTKARVSRKRKILKPNHSAMDEAIEASEGHEKSKIAKKTPSASSSSAAAKATQETTTKRKTRTKDKAQPSAPSRPNAKSAKSSSSKGKGATASPKEPASKKASGKAKAKARGRPRVTVDGQNEAWLTAQMGSPLYKDDLVIELADFAAGFDPKLSIKGDKFKGLARGKMDKFSEYRINAYWTRAGVGVHSLCDGNDVLHFAFNQTSACDVHKMTVALKCAMISAAGFENHEPYEKDGELNLQLKHNALLALYRLGQLSPEPEHGA